MTDRPTARPNPFVGPRAFQRGERLYGRERETMELLDLIIAERIVLLYSPSGAGKTSLIQAALLPELEDEGFAILPPMRVGLQAPPDAELPPGTNRHVLSLLLSLEEALPPERQAAVSELATLTLDDYLAGRRIGQDDPEGVLLVFDQFEEILTTDPTDLAAKEEFFAQVGSALRDRRRWALLAMREEFLAGLDPYLQLLPTRLGTTYRLALLGREAATEAMRQPARDEGVDFTAAAADKLARDLSAVRVQQPDGTTTTAPGHHVEPVQLQVVCRRLWERLPPDGDEIDLDQVEGVGDVDTALREYYAEQVAAIAAGIGLGERTIREWVDRQLITEQGIRGQVLMGPEQSQGLFNTAIWPLVDAHLVRAEKRRGATWFELAHDRLIEPVRQDNEAWRAASLSTLQRQASLWDGAQRPEGLLLEGQELATAEEWAAGHEPELEKHEREFLARSQERSRISRRQQILTIGLVVMCLLAVGAAIFAGIQWNRTEQQKGIAVAAIAARDAAESRFQDEEHARATSDARAALVETRAAGDSLQASQLQETIRAPGNADNQELQQTATAQALAAATVQEEARQLRLTADAASTASADAAQTAEFERNNALNVAYELQGTPTAYQRIGRIGGTARPPAAVTPTTRPTAAATRRPTSTPSPRLIALPDDEEILFVSTRRGGSDLFVVDREAGDAVDSARWISLQPCNAYFEGCFQAGRPYVQPNTRRFVFHAFVPQWDKQSAWDIFLVELQGEQAIVIKNLTDVRGDSDQMQGTFSPDGQQIAMAATQRGSSAIWLMRHDGFDRRPLTAGGEYEDEQPAWSPTGTWIATSSKQRGSDSREIHLVNVENGQERRILTANGGLNRAPDWSPDGRQLAFVHGADVPEDICIINVDGSGQRCYATPQNEDLPVWSGDGNWIAFERFVGSRYRKEIFAIRPDFGQTVRLTYNEADDWGPAWVKK